MSKVCTLVLLFLCVSAPLKAQSDAQDIVQPEKPALHTGLTSFTLDFLNDQKAIWTSPLHVTGNDVKWLAPTGAAVGTLFVFDHRISDALKADTSLRSPSNTVSQIGNIAPYAVPGTMLFLGAVTHDSHAVEAGRLTAEAELDSEVVMTVLKLATARTRPNMSDNKSFPSGHAMSMFTLASVMSHEYHDKPLVVYGSYGVATAVAIARVGGLNHFPSDVLAGAVMGELIGRYVVNHRQAKAAE
jgi:membrane-associated phospholipid phosphatase